MSSVVSFLHTTQNQHFIFSPEGQCSGKFSRVASFLRKHFFCRVVQEKEIYFRVLCEEHASGLLKALQNSCWWLQIALIFLGYLKLRSAWNGGLKKSNWMLETVLHFVNLLCFVRVLNRNSCSTCAHSFQLEDGWSNGGNVCRSWGLHKRALHPKAVFEHEDDFCGSLSQSCDQNVFAVLSGILFSLISVS